MLNIVVPMAGRGSRFVAAGYQTPKPLIEIHGMPMIQLVVRNLAPACDHRFVFVCQQEHVEQYGVDQALKTMAPGCEVLVIDEVTAGAACTVLLTRELIDTEDPLMIANSDQWVDCDVNAYLGRLDETGADGLIMTMTADDPKWSFVRFDADGEVAGVVEKEPVSNAATVGIYNYRYGRDFVAAADAMIAKDLRVNGEFYVAPVYEQMIAAGKRIALYDVGGVADGMYGLGTPEDLDAFIANEVSRRAVGS